jgi:hypothetical protein
MNTRVFILIALNFFILTIHGQDFSKNEWKSIFDGTTLKGWKANKNGEVFSVSKGILIAKGGISHLFYVGPYENSKFLNFELKTEVMTEKGSNSGIFIHTHFQDEGWLKAGYEIQIDNNASAPQMTGSIYNIVPISGSNTKDMEWFNLYIKVNDQRVVIMINNKIIVDYTENDPKKPISVFSQGTIAIQANSVNSAVYFRKIFIKEIK